MCLLGRIVLCLSLLIERLDDALFGNGRGDGLLAYRADVACVERVTHVHGPLLHGMVVLLQQFIGPFQLCFGDGYGGF